MKREEIIELIFFGVRELTNDSAILKEELGKWQGIHPFLSNFDGMMTAQYFSVVLAENSEKIIASQLRSTDKIIASADYNANEISKIFSDSIDTLNSTFEWGFTEIIWQLGQQQEILRKVLKTLQKPLTTQSRELRERGFFAYKNRMYDDAIADLHQAAIDNRYDFTIHQTLGNIYLFHKYDPEKAIDSYQKSAKYAEPRSKKFASFAYLHLGLVYYFMHDYQNAYNSTLKAITLFPESSFCYYEHARYCARLNKRDEAVKSLQKIIYKEPFYCVKINNEWDFSFVDHEVKKLINDVFHHFKQLSENRLEEARDILKIAKIEGVASTSLDGFTNSLKTSEKYHLKSSILDFQKSIIESEEIVSNLFPVLQKNLDDRIEAEETSLKIIPDLLQKSTRHRDIIFLILGAIIMIWMYTTYSNLGILFGTILCGGLAIALAVIFEIIDKPKIEQMKCNINTSIQKFREDKKIIEDLNKKFSYTFYPIKSDSMKISWKNHPKGDNFLNFDDEDDANIPFPESNLFSNRSKKRRFSATPFDTDYDDDDDDDDDDEFRF